MNLEACGEEEEWREYDEEAPRAAQRLPKTLSERKRPEIAVNLGFRVRAPSKYDSLKVRE